MASQAHAMRNELHFRLEELHRLVQCSRFLLAKDQKYLCLLEAGALGRMLSSRIPDELKLVAHRVGRPIILRQSTLPLADLHKEEFQPSFERFSCQTGCQGAL